MSTPSLNIDRRLDDSQPHPFEKMINNKEDADVIILAGADETPIYTHSQILKSQSEYFKTALNWKAAAKAQDDTTTPSQSSSMKMQYATIKLPNITFDVMMLIIKLIYTTQCTIPQDLVESVIPAASELLLTEQLLNPCVEHVATYLLVPSTAFRILALDTYASHPPFFHTKVLNKIASNLDVALREGVEFLMDYPITKLILLISSENALKEVEKWRIVLHWVVSKHSKAPASEMRHVCDFIISSTGSKMGAFKDAARDIELFLPYIALFCIDGIDFETYVWPARDLLPTVLQKQVEMYAEKQVEMFEEKKDLPPKGRLRKRTVASRSSSLRTVAFTGI
ncbi:hypothetical protein HDV05_005484 [Chytridiales sp. JEL 0842]|nr:hypothetical protein HDV05_005484 [Chytridiales sp. JEL 0842]